PDMVKPWTDRFDIMLQSFPLCAIPGVEHLSQSLRKKISSRIHIGNVRFGINRIVPDPVPCEPLLSPYRSVCKGCSLWMICGETDIFVDCDELGDYYDLPVKSDRNPVEILMNSGLTGADSEALVRNFSGMGVWEEAETLEREFGKIFHTGSGEGGGGEPGASMAVEFINANEMILSNGRERGKIVFLPFEFASQPLAVVSDIGIEAKHPTRHELVSGAAAKIGIAIAQAPNLRSWRAAVRDVWASTRPKDFKSTEVPEVIGFEMFRKSDPGDMETIQELEAIFLKLLSPEISKGCLIPGAGAYFLGLCGTDPHIASNGRSGWIRALPEELSRRRMTTVEGIAFETLGEKEAGDGIYSALDKIKQVISAKEGIKAWTAMIRKFWNSNTNASRFMLSAGP
ncbi:MAG: hypothetical protein FJ088_12085, partial [Deltaproteobacteria bacterium]|nr:hypothetical protein [Deltaproteobacteria bacterium]